MRISATGRKRARGRIPAGFTLIELLLVLSVLVIAAAAMTPGFPGFLRNRQLAGAADKLASMARYAREWSMLHERAVILEYDGDSRQFTLTPDEDEQAESALAAPLPANSEEEPQEEEPVLENAYRALRLPEGIQLEAGPVGQEQDAQALESGGQLLFLPDGRSADALLVLSGGSRRFTVRLEGRRGRVTVEAGDGREENNDAR